MSEKTFLRMTFLEWWRVTNRMLESRGQDEMLYGEARDWWNRLSEAQRMADERRVMEAIEAVKTAVLP